MSWDTSRARDVSFTVRVNGTVREHQPDGITWAQDVTSDLPSTVTAGGQVAQRTGTVRWARQRSVETRTPSPWYQGPYWIPTVGDAITIDAHDGEGNTYRVFTGVIDTVEGDAFGERSSKIVAPIVGGNQVVRRQALTQVGGLPAEGRIGRFATTPVWLVSEIARQLGYSSVPPAPVWAKLILDAPLQGSTYVYSEGADKNARLVTSHQYHSTVTQPLWKAGPDGFGISRAFLEWVPYSGQGTGAGAVGISLLVYSVHSSTATVRVSHGTNSTSVAVSPTGVVTVSTTVGGSTTSHTLDLTVPSTLGPHRVSVVFYGGSVSARVNNVPQVFSAATPAAAVSRVELSADWGTCVAGLQVWHPANAADHHAPTWAPTAVYRYGTGTQPTVLTPSVRDQRAGEVLEEYADALLAPMWIDGHGVLQVVTGKALHELAPSLAVDALTDVSDLSYSMSLLDHRPTVEVTYAHAHQSNATAVSARTQVWQGRGGEVTPDTPEEEFIEIPEDEEWIGLSDPANAQRLTFDTREAFNAGTGTWRGLSEDITSPGYLTPVTTGGQIVETLTPWAWKITTSYPGENGAVQRAPTSSYILTRYQGTDLPILRARSLVKYEDRTVAVSNPGATYTDGVLAHDAGKWITTTAAATELADWIHSMVGTPTPVLENLVVRFDPRIDIGIKITVAAQAVFGVDFEALVLSVEHRPGEDTTTVTARVTRVTAYAETLADVDYMYIGQSLAEWDAARAGRTLTEVDANPHTTT